jgi:hypothetical protein
MSGGGRYSLCTPDGKQSRSQEELPMKPTILTILGLVSLAMLALPAAVAQQAPVDTQHACADMMQGQGMSEEGRQAMQQLMQSGRAATLMDGMMKMARQMGNGDAMVGMTRMMEMMGRMGSGGMMGGGGPGGMMPPGQQPPKQ